jgi:hypothetical protein
MAIQKVTRKRSTTQIRSLTKEENVPMPEGADGREALLAHKAALEATLDGILEELRVCEDEEQARVLEARLVAGMVAHTGVLERLG